MRTEWIQHGVYERMDEKCAQLVCSRVLTPPTHTQQPAGVEAQKKVRAVTTYEPCYATAGDDMSSMLRFQVRWLIDSYSNGVVPSLLLDQHTPRTYVYTQALMAVLGGLALYGVRHQKLKHQTLYERRQMGMGRPRRRGLYSGI